MKQFSAVLLVLVLVGCSARPFSGDDNEDDFRVPLVCGPEHNKLPCTAGVEEGVGYRFNLLTHCGIEWAYFDGRYWVPMPMLDAPSHWAGIEAGTIVLEQPGVAVFEADEGGGARFVPAPRSYRPPNRADYGAGRGWGRPLSGHEVSYFELVMSRGSPVYPPRGRRRSQSTGTSRPRSK
jgi:hypothetical protein